MTLMVYVCFLVWTLVVGFTMVGTFLSLKLIRRGRVQNPKSIETGIHYFPPISILKPLKNLDQGIQECVEGFFHLEYPSYELIFCVASQLDPSYLVVRDLIRKYPQVHAQLLVGEAKIGFNPKIDNLIKGYQKAKNDWILISDSNVSASPSYLKDLARYISPKVGLITSSVAGLNHRGFGGRLESLILNTHLTRWALILNALGYAPVSGKVMLFQKSVANQFGGLASLAQYLAEDFMFGERVREMGLKVVLTSELVQQNVGKQLIGSYWDRHIRWGRIRKSISLFGFTLEILINSVVSGLLGGWAFNHWFGIPASMIIFLHLSAWMVCDLLLIQEIEGGFSWLDPAFWITREVSAIPLWLATGLGNTVNWRGQKLRIGAKTRLELAEDGDLSESFETNLSLGGSHQ